MGKKTSKRHQKLYKMKGCSKHKHSKKSSCKHYLGGATPLAYTGVPVVLAPNPFLAYTGKGGSGINENGADPTNPNTGPPTGSVVGTKIPTNQGLMQHGGTCGMCNATSNMMGGGCGCGQLLTGGASRKKRGGCGPCALSLLGGKKQKSGKKQKGGTWAPQGLIGKPWTPDPQGWPGVNGSRNYLEYNSYKVDPQTAMINVGPNPPFLGGKKRKTRKQRGGTLSNLIGQDFINLGRQVQFGIGSGYNGLTGYPAPVSPLPWKDQLTQTSVLNL